VIKNLPSLGLGSPPFSCSREGGEGREEKRKPVMHRKGGSLSRVLTRAQRTLLLTAETTGTLPPARFLRLVFEQDHIVNFRETPHAE